MFCNFKNLKIFLSILFLINFDLFAGCGASRMKFPPGSKRVVQYGSGGEPSYSVELGELSEDELSVRLFNAIRNGGSVEDICLLLNAGAEVNSSMVLKVPKTPLYKALTSMQYKLVTFLLGFGATFLGVKNDEELISPEQYELNTNLHESLDDCNDDEVISFVRHGADANSYFEFVELGKIGPLMLSLLLRRWDVAYALINHPNYNKDIAEDYYLGLPLIHVIAASGRCEGGRFKKLLKVAKCVIEKYSGCVNDMSLYGFYPLHLAAAIGSDKMVRFLLVRGAYARVKDANGRTYLKVVGDILLYIKIDDALFSLYWNMPLFDHYRVIRG